ncbi:COMPASS component BRE2, partial [Tremellales sp. Uapishka_1]
MSTSKWRLSPSLSSRSSSTPIPFANPTELPSSAASPIPPSDSFVPALNNEALGSLASSHPADPSPAPTIHHHARGPSFAKPGSILPGSSDGGGDGDECFLWENIPMNKNNFRYLPCALSPSSSPSSKAISYRTIPPPPPTPSVHISWTDRQNFLRISPNALSVSTDRGFRSARANMSVRTGSWYYEVLVERGNGSVGGGVGSGELGNPHVRVGWGRRESNLDAPVGLDGYSYGIRDVNGEKVHCSRPVPYGHQGIGKGDIVGCLIKLPPRQLDQRDIKRRRVAFKYQNGMYFEMTDYKPQKEMNDLVNREGKGNKADGNHVNGEEKAERTAEVKTKNTSKGKIQKKSKLELEVEKYESGQRELPRLAGSSISFFINGRPLGEAFSNLYDFLPLPTSSSASSHEKGRKEKPVEVYDDGTLGYYPMVSCFGRGKIKCNFGPDFAFPPLGEDVRGMNERYDEFKEEEKMLDERDEADEAQIAMGVLLESIQSGKQSLLGDEKVIKKKRTATKKKKVVMMDSEVGVHAGSLANEIKMEDEKGLGSSRNPSPVERAGSVVRFANEVDVKPRLTEDGERNTAGEERSTPQVEEVAEEEDQAALVEESSQVEEDATLREVTDGKKSGVSEGILWLKGSSPVAETAGQTEEAMVVDE